MTKRADQLLREAAKFLASAEQKQSKADDDKWAAAERMWKVNKEEGISQREIAGAVGVSEETVRIYVNIITERPNGRWETFTDAYYSIRSGATPGEREERAVERVARERPEIIARVVEATPGAARAIASHAPARLSVSKAADDHYEQIEKQSREKFVESVGQDVADGLEAEQRLRDAETKLFEARRALRDMLALLHESDVENLRDSWREDFLKTLDDLAMRVDVARSLLGGTLDADLEQFLAEV